VPGIAGIASASGVNRVIARIALDAGIDTSTLINDSYLGNNIRAAATVNGTGYWTGGTTATNDAGVRYVVHGSTGATQPVYTDIQNVRAVHVYGGQLYASTQSGGAPDGGYSRIFAVGTGAPMSSATVAYLPGVMTTTPNDFVLLDRESVAGLDTLYVAETTGGIKKYTFDGTTWAETGNFTAGLGNQNCYGVAALNLGSSVVLLCSTGASVYRFDDTGSSPGNPAASLVVTAPSGTVFRGIVFVQ